MIGGKWTGLEEALRNVEALGAEVGQSEVVGPALLRVGRDLKDDIVRGAPRSKDNRHMADEFVAKVSKEELEFGRTTVLVGPTGGKGSVGFVAGFNEFGTYKMAARPFIRPAYDGWVGGGGLATLAIEIRTQFERVIRKYTRRAK